MSAPTAAVLPFTPCVRIGTETLMVSDGGLAEVEMPVIELGFDYGGVYVRPDGASDVPRALDQERQARYLLESFGAVELACLDEVSAGPGSRADYVVRVDLDVHGLCSFTSYALPQLRALGWRVDLADDYPFQVVDAEAPWYARLEPESGSDDWFNLELGIELEGRRVNLLPALLDLLERLPAAGRLEALIPSGARCYALPVGDKKYFPIPPERLRILVGVLRELYDPEARALSFAAAKAASLAALDAAFAGRPMRWQGATGVRDRGRALASDPRPVEVPGGLRASLRPYQREGLSWLQNLRAQDASGVLADDMGLGKTLQAIAHLVAEKEAGRLNAPALVVAPTSLVGNWRRELQRFAPQLRVTVLYGPQRRRLFLSIPHSDVVITTYSVLVRDEARLAARVFSMLILDEAQALKNARSQVHRAAEALRAPHRLALTGTPIENGLVELWALFDLLMPGLLGDADWFRHRFAHPIEREGNAERLSALRAQVAPFILRRTKEEVARDLPPKTELVRAVELRGRQRDLYESLRVAAHAEVRQAIRRKGLTASTITILDALMKLRQVCCDPRLLPGETAMEVRESAKHDLFMELLTQQLERGRRVLVFSQFASMLALLSASLRRAGIRHSELTGATGDRQRAVDTFEQRRVEVFLISLKAGGTGLNLTSADTVIHYDPWWNPAAQAQATGRAHRIGQTRPVFVHKLIAAGTVEERMLALQRRKQQLADSLLASSGGAALPLSAQDVDRLFAPIADDAT
jgi:superfamily II DNA or RNA helicase